MQQYLTLLHDVYMDGEKREARNGVTHSVFDRRLTFDLRKGFPILTTKTMPFKIIAGELIAFLRGYRSLDQFHKLGAGNIWKGDAMRYHGVTEDDMGRIYGVQWRRWRTHKPILDDADALEGPYIIKGYQEIDQLHELVYGLIHNPHGRRHVVSAWNPGDLNEMCLPPCHMLFQCYKSNNGHLDLKMTQRSADLFLGVPFNITSYALLLWLLSFATSSKPRFLTIELGDVHLYEAHFDAVREQLLRRPTQDSTYCYLKCDPLINPSVHEAMEWLESIQPEDMGLGRYDPWPAIKAPLLTRTLNDGE